MSAFKISLDIDIFIVIYYVKRIVNAIDC